MANTKAQELAITTIDKNIAINAGAGTGKTKVLTERYINILENGTLPDNREIESIVAITFTKKATQEMKERIRDEIKSKFHMGPEWRKYYKDMEKANISTIHSLCANILKDNALEANIDPMFGVLDGDDGELLLEETILKLILKGIEDKENIYNMVKIFNSDDLSRIVEEIKSIYYEIRTVGHSFEDVKDMTINSIDNIKVDFSELEYIKETLKYLIENSRKNSKLFKLKENDIWNKFYEGHYEDDELIDILEFLSNNIGTNKKEKETIEKLNNSIDNMLLIKEKENKWLYETVLELLIQVDKEYTKEKEKIGSLDYDDLQILVLKLLDIDSIKQRYQDKFRYIMVDEFQDTNELQKKIFYKLCSKDKKLDRSNLFIVGDPKQSIYGFRGADLEVFYDVMDDIEEVSNQKTILLDKNFRTVDTVLKFVNNIFGKLMKDKYDRLDNHHVSKNQIDIEVLEKEGLEIPDNENKSDYNTYYEGQLIASRIKELVDSEAFKYGDFCLLFRSTTVDYIYEEALEEYKIPYYNVGGKGFYKCQEIVDLMNGLKAISNPYDNISTIGFLRGPMIGLSDKTIYWLLRFKEDNLLETLKKEIPNIEVEEQKKILEAEKILSKLIVKKGLYRISDLLEEFIDETYFAETLLLSQGGKQAVSNVYKFLEISREYDRKLIGSLEDFIDYIESLKDKDESQAKIESENSNVVKIMTIHKSKGLQFPVVIIPQMARGFNYQQPSILFDKDKGIGLKYDKSSAFYNSMKEKVRKKEDEENQRILYVAMTRAESRLIIGNQGRNSGFKGMVKDLIDLDEAKYIDEIKINRDKKTSIKSIDEELLQKKEFDQNQFPLIRELPGYNKKTFPGFSVSQYIEFNQCKKQFFMNYYKKLPFDYYTGHGEGEDYVIEPSIRGNIMHKFCEYYRENKEPIGLMKQVVKSYGIEYNEDIQKELNPYMENYLKNYTEDYDEVYFEKKFHLKIEDTYINGIIDRINIKDGKAEILDFKTNKVEDKEELKNKYKPQLQLYAYAFQKINKMKVSKASILLLETGEFVDIDIRKESLDKNYKNIKQFIKFVNSNNTIEKYEGNNNCKEYCKYNNLCNFN